MPHLRPTTCPSCNSSLLEAQELTSNDQPQDGQFHICGVCNSLHVYHDGLKLRPATQREYLECQKLMELEDRNRQHQNELAHKRFLSSKRNRN